MKLLQISALLALAGTMTTMVGQYTLESAQNLARGGQRSEALKLLEDHLAVEPSDNDARVLRGTILSWDGRYDESRHELELVLSNSPGYGDAITPLMNVYMWSRHPERAELLARRELERHPGDPELLLALAKALEAMHRMNDAALVMRKLVQANPADAPAKEFYDKVAEEAQSREVTLTQTSDWFSRGFAPWREEQLAMVSQTALGALTGRFSDAGRFGLNSQQMEVEFYPHLSSRTYAYVDVGYSPDAALYPRYRAGADIYHNAGHGFEISAGYRRLEFAPGIDIYTAALSKYQGRWLISSKVYLTPGIGSSRSGQFSLRRYLKGESDYATFIAGWGSSPLEITSTADIGILKAASLGGDINHRLSRRISVIGHASVAREDRSNYVGIFHYTADLALHFHF